MRITDSPFSCGFKVITGVQMFGRDTFSGKLTGPQFVKQLEDYISREKGRRASIGNGGGAKSRMAKIGFIFSDTTEYADLGGRGLAAYIRENKLGDLQESVIFTNYNSGNNIRCWIFVPDIRGAKKAKPKPRIAAAKQA